MATSYESFAPKFKVALIQLNPKVRKATSVVKIQKPSHHLFVDALVS